MGNCTRYTVRIDLEIGRIQIWIEDNIVADVMANRENITLRLVADNIEHNFNVLELAEGLPV